MHISLQSDHRSDAKNTSTCFYVENICSYVYIDILYVLNMYHLTIARLILFNVRQGTAMCLVRNVSSKRTDCLTKFLASEHICKMVCGTAKPLVPAGRGKERLNSKTCRKYEILVLEVQQICRRSTYFQQLFSSLKNIC